ncbi:MAG TPA: hypothetical protein VFA34_02605 [Actinomycetota bacterium]|nr:hypothetical protein [Actinomycetota bacterium]
MSPERLFVLVTASGLLASYAVTWALWRPRLDPPNLPAAAGAPRWAYGVLLVTAAGTAIVLPRLGAVAHAVLLVAAVLADQIRLQPEFVSLSILLMAAAWPRNGIHVARWHLLTLWFWAGLNKVLSAGWPLAAGTFADFFGVPGSTAIIAVTVPAVEIGLGLLGLRPRTWGYLRWAAPVFHLGTFGVLALRSYNVAVWPWNVALAAAVPLVFIRPASGRPGGLPGGRRGKALAATAALLVLYPAGFYVGLVDAYMAHNLYTSNTTEGYVCAIDARNVRCDRALVFSTFDSLNVPMPPEKRVFDAYFDRTCEAEEILRIDGRWIRFADRDSEFRPCPD